MGDINQNCTDCNLALTGSVEERSDEYIVQLSVPRQPLLQGQHVVIPISVEHFNDITVFAAYLGYDAEALQIEKVIPGDLPIEFGSIALDRDAAVIRYAWGAGIYNHGQTLQDGGSILLIYAKVLQDVTVPEDAFWFVTEEDRTNELYDMRHNRGVFADKIKGNDFDQSTQKLTIQAFPNPFQDYLTVSFYMPEEGIGNLSITDVTGKEVAGTTGYRGPGQNYWQVQNLPKESGIYFCRISVGNATQTIKIIRN